MTVQSVWLKSVTIQAVEMLLESKPFMLMYVYSSENYSNKDNGR